MHGKGISNPTNPVLAVLSRDSKSNRKVKCLCQVVGHNETDSALRAPWSAT